MAFPFDFYQTDIPELATSKEIVLEAPIANTSLPAQQSIEIDTVPEFLIAVTSAPNGTQLDWIKDDVRLDITDPNNHGILPNIDYDNSADFFINPTLFIRNKPLNGKWTIKISSSGKLPFAVNVIAYHPSTSVIALPTPQAAGQPSTPLPAPAQRVPFKCGACKKVLKGLAISIVAAATLTALPQALITTVGALLGMAQTAAAAFIMSVITDTVGGITEKSCKAIGLCPY